MPLGHANDGSGKKAENKSAVVGSALRSDTQSPLWEPFLLWSAISVDVSPLCTTRKPKHVIRFTETNRRTGNGGVDGTFATHSTHIKIFLFSSSYLNDIQTQFSVKQNCGYICRHTHSLIGFVVCSLVRNVAFETTSIWYLISVRHNVVVMAWRVNEHHFESGCRHARLAAEANKQKKIWIAMGKRMFLKWLNALETTHLHRARVTSVWSIGVRKWLALDRKRWCH